MSSVLGQIGQNVADNLFELGQGAVKGTVGVVADVAQEAVEQVIPSHNLSDVQYSDKQTGIEKNKNIEDRKMMEKRRFEEVRSELARYSLWKKEQDRKIAEEKSAEGQQRQKEKIEKKEKDNWVKRMINRSQTPTEKGRLVE